jgi:thiosulfate/3-mercaptopyruvate sulfurtransferase
MTRLRSSSRVVAALAVAAMVAGSHSVATSHGLQIEAAKGPWSQFDTIEPSELAKTLADGIDATITYIGPRVLYRAGHIPGATLHGPTSEAHGLDDLKQWANGLSRSKMLVIYCGCCPIEKCPNVRPAFSALRQMGFTNLRVLMLPTSFEKDWVEKGFAVER